MFIIAARRLKTPVAYVIKNKVVWLVLRVNKQTTGAWGDNIKSTSSCAWQLHDNMHTSYQLTQSSCATFDMLFDTWRKAVVGKSIVYRGQHSATFYGALLRQHLWNLVYKQKWRTTENASSSSSKMASSAEQIKTASNVRNIGIPRHDSNVSVSCRRSRHIVNLWIHNMHFIIGGSPANIQLNQRNYFLSRRFCCCQSTWRWQWCRQPQFSVTIFI